MSLILAAISALVAVDGIVSAVPMPASPGPDSKAPSSADNPQGYDYGTKTATLGSSATFRPVVPVPPFVHPTPTSVSGDEEVGTPKATDSPKPAPVIIPVGLPGKPTARPGVPVGLPPVPIATARVTIEVPPTPDFPDKKAVDIQPTAVPNLISPLAIPFGLPDVPGVSSEPAPVVTTEPGTNSLIHEHGMPQLGDAGTPDGTEGPSIRPQQLAIPVATGVPEDSTDN